MKRLFHEKGSLTLETAIVLPIFFFMFMGVFCFFGYIGARNEIHHALIQSAKSLSMDTILNENVESLNENKAGFWETFADLVIDIIRIDTDEYYSTSTDWYKNSSSTEIVKKRFIGYLTGSESDTVAQDKSEKLGVVDGLEGVNFQYSVTDGELEITATYELKIWFDFFGLTSFPMQDTVCAKMWGFDDSASSEA